MKGKRHHSSFPRQLRRYQDVCVYSGTHVYNNTALDFHHNHLQILERILKVRENKLGNACVILENLHFLIEFFCF